ncbi:LysR substrate-binding domain-containing protein [Pseudonocardia endophytica]|uniref:LysR family transcriptional regulator n=1 Tax=Pseudonocardia endophytica TaxID=401976 RepID=A0A4R1HXS0_PSEEN|nr:LysR substrate-binding domain-containing protein [Pseudonocardia endophytica]TCK25915.1 LysR family transcriptional regulator [Pseudonocardia endophytica]
MELADLELVAAVADAGSITHGAVRAHLSLPSASARIRALERSVGAPLFDRDRRGVTPTPAGRLLLEHARDILRSVGRMRVELAEYTEGHGATVRVLAGTSARTDVVPAVTSFLRDRPTVRIDLAESTSTETVAALAARRAELGLVSDTTDMGELRSSVLRADPLVVVVPPGDPLTGGGAVSFADVLRRPFVGLSQGSALAEYLEGHAMPLGGRPVYRVRLPGLDAVCHAVAHGGGVAVLPRHGISAWLDDGRLAAVDLDEPWAHRSLVVCHRDESELSATALALRDHLVAGG